ncbi:hypothetical protein KBC54_03215 [Patescibacteria group bacterium]|nr:hypothetical protein [Patescibacteria group bacterium]
MPLDRNDGQFMLLRTYEILADVVGHRLDGSNGIILMPCGDGDQFHDLYKHLAETVQFQSLPRIHVLSLNGGALLIPEHSPFNKERDYGSVLIEHAVTAVKLKGIQTIVLEAHAPCGMARAAGLDLVSVVRLLVAAKRRLKVHLPNVSVALFFHAHRADCRNTYFVSAQKFEEWFDRHRDRALDIPATS